MLTFAASVLREYALIWKGDPALKQPEIPADATEDEIARLKDEHDRAWVRAVETGRWDDLKRQGAEPTVFVCRPIPGPTWRAFVDYVNREEHGVGGFQRPALAFRLAVTRIDGYAPGRKVELVDHVDKDGNRTGLGRVLSDDVIATLDAADPDLVTVLGYAILKNRMGPHPL